MKNNFFHSKISLKVVVGIVLLISIPSETIAQTKRITVASRIINEKPKIDGFLNDKAWELVKWQADFIQHMPYENAPPSQKTEYKILYNNNSIFIAIRAWDSSPDSIVNRLSRRDNGDGDYIGVEFDTYFDKQTAYSFLVFASGVKTDKILTNDGSKQDFSWDAIWDAKTSIDSGGWNAEIEIPINQLRFNNKDVQTWGLLVGRGIYRKGELSLSQHIPRETSGWVRHYGILDSISNIKPKRLFDIAPYVLLQAERLESSSSNPLNNGNKNSFHGGVDTKIGLSNDFILDLTFFPDFGQVEADPSEVNLTAFETYLPEKRPFFIEGKNLFDYNFAPGDGAHSAENLFYSRRIGRKPKSYYVENSDEISLLPNSTDIISALKVTGRNKNGFSLGIMEVVTSKEYAKVYSDNTDRNVEIEPLTNYFVGSFNQEYSNGNTQIGAIVTSTNRNNSSYLKDFFHNNAYSGGLNFIHYWKHKKYYLGLKSYFSHVNGSTNSIRLTQLSSTHYFQRPDATHKFVDTTRTSLTGSGGGMYFGKESEGSWRYAGYITWKSPELELNDIGYIREVDEVFQVFWVGYRYWTPFSIFKEINLNFNEWTSYNFSGELNVIGTNVNADAHFKNYSSLGLSFSNERNIISYNALRGGPALKKPNSSLIEFWVESNSKRKTVLTVSTSFSTSESDKYTTYSSSIKYKPGNALSFYIVPSYTKSRHTLQYVENISSGNITYYINASLERLINTLELSAHYSITPDLSIQFFSQIYFSKGRYFDFKKITSPKADIFSDRFEAFNPNQVYYESNLGLYSIDDNNDGNIDFSFVNPDFNFRDLKSNLIVRWEYKPGSTLFLVWSHGRESIISDYNVPLINDAHDLMKSFPNNVFLLKFSYRFY